MPHPAPLGGSSGCDPLVFENHPADSRVKIAEDGVVQTLNARMGTGGGNVPLIMCLMHDGGT